VAAADGVRAFNVFSRYVLNEVLNAEGAFGKDLAAATVAWRPLKGPPNQRVGQNADSVLISPEFFPQRFSVPSGVLPSSMPEIHPPKRSEL
jgi:hypothetical protein